MGTQRSQHRHRASLAARLPHVLGCLAAFSLALGCGGEGRSRDEEVRVSVRTVMVDRASAAPVVVLAEVAGSRQLPIWIGVHEARSIALELDQRSLPRPNGHDIAKHLLGGLDAELDRVVVTELRGSTFYAVMRIATGEKFLEIDARPSDAIAIALRVEAPIFVHEQVFAQSNGEALLEEPELEL